MNNREAQNELCRSTKTPEEVYRLVILYEQGDKYSKTYVATSRITGTQESAGRAIQIKSKPVGKKQGAFKNGLSRGRGMYHGRGLTRGGGEIMMQSNRYYNCDQPNFTREHVDKCPVKGVTCYFRRKTGHFERTCRGNPQGNRTWIWLLPGTLGFWTNSKKRKK